MDMEELLSIGDMAKINHITVNTLRLYDKWGLLKPAYINHETNYRYYDIKRTIYSLERYRKSPTPGTLTTEFIDERSIYKAYVSKSFYDYGLDAYEMILKEFKNNLIHENLPEVYYCNVGTFLSKENFLHQHFETHTSFIFVNEHFPLKEKVEKLESGMYAIGDYICEVLIELTFFNQNNRSMYLRLQVPIAFKKTLDPHQ